MTSKRETSRTAVLAAQVLAGACLVTALSLGGCDSDTAKANKSAQQQAQEAARIARSAGDIRPTDKFTNDLMGKPKAEQDTLAKDAKKQIEDDKENAKGVWKTYFEQRSVAEDLKLSIDKLKSAASTAGLNDPALKSAIHSQVGSTTAAQAQEKLNAAEARMASLVEKAIDIWNGAQFLESLGKNADVLEKRAQFIAPSAGSKMTVEEARGAAGKAQQVVTDLEKQIAEKEAKAADIYARTDAAFAKADQMTGLEAIEHSKKAVEERKQADALRAEVSTMQPQLARAKMELELAKIRQADAESQSSSMASITSRGQDAAKATAKQASDTREEVQKLMKAKDGLEAQLEDFKKLASELQKETDDAAAMAISAASTYRTATSEWDSYKNELTTKLADQPKFATLLSQVKAPETRQLLELSEAAAHAQAGQALLLQTMAERYRGSVLGAMAKARAAGGQATTEPTTAPDESALIAKAKTELTAARDIAAKVAGSASDRQKFDYEVEGARKSLSTGLTCQWLALSLKAVASHGLYSLAGDAKDLKDAQDAAQRAKDLNPFLPITSLVETATP